MTALHFQVNNNRYDNLIVSGEVWIKPLLISAYLKCHTIRLYFLLSNLIFVEPRYTCDNRFETVKVFFDPCFMKSVKVNTCNQEHVNTTVETTKRNIKFLRNSYKLPCIPIKALKITLYYKRNLPNNIFHNKTNKIVDAVLTFLCGNTSVNNFLFFFVILMSPLKGM